jgi:Protein of unknown function (DUF1570)
MTRVSVVLCSILSTLLFAGDVVAGDVAPSGDERDVVVLKSGKEIKCRVVLEMPDRIAILQGTREKWIDRKKIRSITTIQTSLRDILTKFETAAHNADELMKLGKACAAANLPHEARLFYWSVVLLDVNHVAANSALGHKLAGKTWRVPVDGSWRKLESAEKVRAAWGKAWRLRSEHFELRTDAGLRRGVETLLELESFYRHLFDLFQVNLELREVTIPIQVHLYRDGVDFPRLSNNVDAYFSLDDNVLFTFLDDVGRPLTLFHQATHATIFNLGGSRRGRRTELPGWLNEGWADYMEGILVPGEHGRLKLDLNRRVGYRIGNLAAEKKPYSLRRVLNLRETDFSASSRQALKYAQSYALFLFMMESGSGKYTDDFLIYMKKALAGKASASAFRNVFKKDLKTIEQGHLKMK